MSIQVSVTDNQEPPSSRCSVVSIYPNMEAAVASMRENYAPEGELDDIPDDRVAAELENSYGLSVEVSED